MKLRKMVKKFGIYSLILITIISLTGCVNKNTDSYRFKDEYESINNKKTGYKNTKYKKVKIKEDNKVEYLSAKELVLKIDNQDTMLVYFGFAECPWCRSIVENLMKVSEEYKMKVYYVNVKNIRDEKKVDKEGNIKTKKSGDDYYYDLLDRLNGVLSDYMIDDTYMKEKRIYAPNIVAIANGEPIEMTEGIPEDFKDPYKKMTKKQKKASYNQIKCLAKCIQESESVCTKNSC